MLPTSTLTAFVAVVLVLFVIPGPAVLLVLSRTVQGGRNTGIMTGLGIAAGDFVHALFAAVGLSALLMASALAFDFVKLAGADAINRHCRKLDLLLRGRRSCRRSPPKYSIRRRPCFFWHSCRSSCTPAAVQHFYSSLRWGLSLSCSALSIQRCSS
jgi:hypothetical protein